jgi:hypothetical protein
MFSALNHAGVAGGETEYPAEVTTSLESYLLAQPYDASSGLPVMSEDPWS